VLGGIEPPPAIGHLGGVEPIVKPTRKRVGFCFAEILDWRKEDDKHEGA